MTRTVIIKWLNIIESKVQESKRFILAYKKELDNGLSGYTMFFTSKQSLEVMGPQSSAKVIVNEFVSASKEADLRQHIKTLGLKTNKWFTEQETGKSVGKLKSQLGYSLLAKLLAKIS